MIPAAIVTGATAACVLLGIVAWWRRTTQRLMRASRRTAARHRGWSAWRDLD